MSTVYAKNLKNVIEKSTLDQDSDTASVVSIKKQDKNLFLPVSR